MPFRPILIAIILSLAAISTCTAVPTEQTPYAKAGLRLEARPHPTAVNDDITRPAREKALADAGVQARWIKVTDDYGAPLINNPFIPCTDAHAADNEIILKKWVSEIKKSGMAAVTWYPMQHCHSGWEQIPAWRQVFQIPYNASGFAVCFESGYGDALMNYCNYVIDKFGLDGIWFDGTCWTPIWGRPLPMSCTCDACKAKFKADTGCDVPTKIDWDDAVFRKWVNWRYKEFGSYIGKVAASIRKEHPNVSVAINNYHRPRTPWLSALPIDIFKADVISGSEASDPDSIDINMRLNRAYGRSQSEIWRFFDVGNAPEVNAETIIQHAMMCYVAGGHPSYGEDLLNPRMAPTAALASPAINAINAYSDGKSLPYAAVHVSQQTETFYCERGGLNFFDSLSIWTQALGNRQVPPDYVFDADFTSTKLAKYKLLFMPLSLALSDTQSKIAIDYIKNGGTAVLGLASGQLNEEAMPRKSNLLASVLGFSFSRAPKTDGSDAGTFVITAKGTNKTYQASGVRIPLILISSGWTTLATVANQPAAAVRKFGKGRVVVLAIDPAVTVGSFSIASGNTSIATTNETAAAGKGSLKFTDDPVAPMSWNPDLENSPSPFGAPDYIGGILDFDMRVGADAEVLVALRSKSARERLGEQACPGPAINFGGGKINIAGNAFCDLPIDQWIHVNLAYDFASGTQISKSTLTVTLPDGTKKSINTTTENQSYDQTDWLVVSGGATKHAAFYLDNFKLEAVKADGTTKSAINMDFENGSGLLDPPTQFIGSIIDQLKQIAPSQLKVIAPDYVRAGIFEGRNKEILVHLHNTKGQRADWQKPTGPTITLDCGFAVKSAKLAISGKPLTVAKLRNRWQIKLPQIGSYQVVEIQKNTK